MPEKNLITSIKIPPGLLNLIDTDLETNQDFRNRSEWIVAAIRQYLDYRTEIIAKRKTAFNSEESDFTPSRNLSSDEVKD